MSILTGLITGVLFGFVLQRGRLCFNSGFRDLRMTKDNFLFKTIALAIALQILAFHAMAQFGLIHLSPKPLNWIGVTAGAFVFGLGMVVAGGCASGVTYRTGEGNTTAWLALIFYGLTAWATKAGSLSGLLKAVEPYTVKTDPNSALYISDKIGPSLATLLNVDPWIVAVVAAALILVYVFATKTTERASAPWSWWLAAVAVTAVAMFGFWASGQAGRMYGLGVTGGWISVFKTFAAGGELDWEGAEVLGIVLGALVTALVYKEFKFRVPRDGKTFLQVAIGGAMMGFGAVMAGGCNIGHVLTGVPQLAVSSIIAGVFFVLGNWTATWFMYERESASAEKAALRPGSAQAR